MLGHITPICAAFVYGVVLEGEEIIG